MFKKDDRVLIKTGTLGGKQAKVVVPIDSGGFVGVKIFDDPFTYWYDKDELELISVSNSVSVSVPNSVSFSVPAGSNVNVHASAGARVVTENKDDRLIITVEWE